MPQQARTVPKPATSQYIPYLQTSQICHDGHIGAAADYFEQEPARNIYDPEASQNYTCLACIKKRLLCMLHFEIRLIQIFLMQDQFFIVGERTAARCQLPPRSLQLLSCQTIDENNISPANQWSNQVIQQFKTHETESIRY